MTGSDREKIVANHTVREPDNSDGSLAADPVWTLLTVLTVGLYEGWRKLRCGIAELVQ